MGDLCQVRVNLGIKANETWVEIDGLRLRGLRSVRIDYEAPFGVPSVELRLYAASVSGAAEGSKVEAKQ